MSRHSVPSRDGRFEIVIGWDPPCRNFFAQVAALTTDDDEAALVLWDEYDTIAELVDAVRPYGDVTDELRSELARESGRPAAWVEPRVRPEIVTLRGVECRVLETSYPAGGTALILFIAPTDPAALGIVEAGVNAAPAAARRAAIATLIGAEAPYATATVCIPEERLEPGELLVKTWGENEGVLEALEAGGVVRDTGRRVPTGYVEAAVCAITPLP